MIDVINKIFVFLLRVICKKKEKNVSLKKIDDLKYIFPNTEVDFKNFGKEISSYSSIIHHHENMLNSVKNFLSNESVDKTIYYLKTLNTFYKNFSDFYIKLLRLDKLLTDELTKKISTNIQILFSVSVWGKQYAEKFCLVGLNSLKDDLIEINKQNKIQLVVFADINSKKIIENNKNYLELFNLDIMRIICIPGDIFELDYYRDRFAITRYYIFGFIQNICWRYSASKNLNLSLITPDNYYSKNFFQNLIKKTHNNNLLAIFSSSSFKVQISKIEDIEKNIYSLKKMSVGELFEFFKKNIHHSHYDHFILKNKKIENNSPYYILNSNEALYVYSVHCHPYLISKNYLKKFSEYFSFLPIDEYFPINNYNDIDYFEKLLSIEDGIMLDFASLENLDNKNMINYSKKIILENFLKYKNNKLNMWSLKKPIKISHTNKSELIFNNINKKEVLTKKELPCEKNNGLKDFEEIIKKLEPSKD